MGYTHYYTLTYNKKKQLDNEIKYQRAIKKVSLMVRAYNNNLKLQDNKHPARLSGYTPHTVPGHYKGVQFNGTGELMHEDFCLPESFQDFNDFCKTAEKPYDGPVTAALIILKYYLGDNVDIGSDGNSADWLRGLHIAKTFTGLKRLSIPNTIRKATYNILKAV